jgi:2-polyprenyl-6-hydroxyphenyl methylase/3-demethylubiquinone-9 3-methyltransferase
MKENWWDTKGNFKILHHLAPLRLKWITQNIQKWKNNFPDKQCDDEPNFFPHRAQCDFQKKIFRDMSILDVGCGGGLLAEPLASLGASVIGIDRCKMAIQCARAHKPHDLSLHYEQIDLHHFSPLHAFDAIIIMEVLEHLKNPFSALQKCASWLAPGRLLIGSTLNRTTLSYILGIVCAEYILRWIPKGTHQWKNFIRPMEIQTLLECAGFHDIHFQGFFLKPTGWSFSKNESVNYFFSAFKK